MSAALPMRTLGVRGHTCMESHTAAVASPNVNTGDMTLSSNRETHDSNSKQSCAIAESNEAQNTPLQHKMAVGSGANAVLILRPQPVDSLCEEQRCSTPTDAHSSSDVQKDNILAAVSSPPPVPFPAGSKFVTGQVVKRKPLKNTPAVDCDIYSESSPDISKEVSTREVRKKKNSRIKEKTPATKPNLNTTVSCSGRAGPSGPPAVRSGAMRRQKYFISKGNNSQLLLQAFKFRKGWSPSKVASDANFIWRMYKSRNDFELPHSRRAPRIINHFLGNTSLVSKAGLFKSLKEYHHRRGTDLWKSVPMTFYLRSGEEDEELSRFLNAASLTDDTNAAVKNPNTSESDGGSDASRYDGTNSAKISCVQGVVKKPPQFWIVKPASSTNRGVGIRVVKSITEVLEIVNRGETKAVPGETSEITRSAVNLSDAAKTGSHTKRQHTSHRDAGIMKIGKKKKKKKKRPHQHWIVQEYMANPLLYMGRKFDIRVFVLLISRRFTGNVSTTKPKRKNSSGKARSVDVYVFNDGYMRTSSRKWSLDPKRLSDRLMHLTNDGVQCKGGSGQYGKFEEGNKLSYAVFEEYLSQTRPEARGTLHDVIIPRIHELIVESIEATASTLNPKCRSHCFELLGYDFMVDETLNTWLIEVNSNPCLEDWSCPLLKGMLPTMVNQVVGKIVDGSQVFETNEEEDSGTSLDPNVKRRFIKLSNVELEGENIVNCEST